MDRDEIIAASRPFRPLDARIVLGVVALLAVLVFVVNSCERSASNATFARLNKDPVFHLVPPEGKIEWSNFPSGCAGSNGNTTAGEMHFIFQGEQAAVADFYRSELPDQGWEISGERPDGSGVSIDARKKLGGGTHYLTVFVGDRTGSLAGHVPNGTCP